MAGLINGSEPVSITSIEQFNAAFAPHGLSPSAVKPSYGMAEATLFVSTTPHEPDRRRFTSTGTSSVRAGRFRWRPTTRTR